MRSDRYDIACLAPAAIEIASLLAVAWAWMSLRPSYFLYGSTSSIFMNHYLASRIFSGSNRSFQDTALAPIDLS